MSIKGMVTPNAWGDQPDAPRTWLKVAMLSEFLLFEVSFGGLPWICSL